MQRYWFYLYILSIILFFSVYGVLKCGYNISTLDFILFTDHTNNNVLNTIMYYLSHFIFYFAFGLLFSFDIFTEMIIKTVALEVFLVMSKNCSFTSLNGMDSAATSIAVGMTSYILGALVITAIRKYWWNKNK